LRADLARESARDLVCRKNSPRVLKTRKLCAILFSNFGSSRMFVKSGGGEVFDKYQNQPFARHVDLNVCPMKDLPRPNYAG
jgi:hypothetical protein